MAHRAALLLAILAAASSCTQLTTSPAGPDATDDSQSGSFGGGYWAPVDPAIGLDGSADHGSDAGSGSPDDAGATGGGSDLGAADAGGQLDDTPTAAHPPVEPADPDAGPAGGVDALAGADVSTSPTTTGGSGGAQGLTSGACGPRAYTAYVPASGASGPAPVVIGTYGYGDDHANFANTALLSGWKGAADANGFILLFPASLNPSQPTFLYLSGAGELDWPATAAEIDGVLACVYDGLGAKYDVDTTQIYWIGFSEGGVVADLAAWRLNKELRAAAPYAGGVQAKPFPVDRKIPVYFVCGTEDSGYAAITGVHGEWAAAGHPTNAAWVQGVGHTFSALCQSGPAPSAVWEWMSTVPAEPVVSGFPGGGPIGPGDPVDPPTGPQGSGGSGGAFPGSVERIVSVPGLGSQTVYLYVPSSYAQSTPTPLLLALHGAGGAGTAPQAAAATRDAWVAVAEANGFIVVAQAATGASGGWVPSTDVAVLNAALEDLTGAYNVDIARIYGWGFSAGGHFMHALGLQNADLFAGYGVSAGSLAALAGQSAPASASRIIPVDIHVGTGDPLFPAVSQDPSAFQKAGWTLGDTLTYVTFPGGHTFEAAHLAEIWANIQ